MKLRCQCGEDFERGWIGRPTFLCFKCRKKRHLRQVAIWREANKDRMKRKTAEKRAANLDASRKRDREYMRKYRGKKKIEELLKAK